MSQRILSIEEATDLRQTREQFGTSYRALGEMFGCNRGTAWSICTGDTYVTEQQTYRSYRWDEEPTPHDQLTFTIAPTELHVWFRSSSRVRANHEAARRTYTAQNERDGYERGIVDRGWLFYGAAWATTDNQIAAD